MKTVGLLVQESLDFTERGLFESAFVSVCAALAETAKKAFEKESFTESDGKKFIEENLRLISLMGVPTVLREIESPYEFRKTDRKTSAGYPLKNFLFFVVHQTAVGGKLPAAFTFSDLSAEANVGKVLLPGNLVWALLASVIFHPSNKNEKIPDKYWFSVGDFKMFVSELWGRRDLIERIMKFYREREGN